jgi:hypothetical protein
VPGYRHVDRLASRGRLHAGASFPNCCSNRHIAPSPLIMAHRSPLQNGPIEAHHQPLLLTCKHGYFLDAARLSRFDLVTLGNLLRGHDKLSRLPAMNPPATLHQGLRDSKGSLLISLISALQYPPLPRQPNARAAGPFTSSPLRYSSIFYP